MITQHDNAQGASLNMHVCDLYEVGQVQVYSSLQLPAITRSEFYIFCLEDQLRQQLDTPNTELQLRWTRNYLKMHHIKPWAHT